MKSITAISVLTLTIAAGLLIYTQTKAPAANLFQRSIPAPWSGNERIIPKLQEQLKQDPENPEWNSALGLAYLQKARETGDPSYYSKADALFDRALASKRNHIDALIGHASLAMSRHEFQQARDIAERTVRLNPDIVATYGVLADAQTELGDYDAAVKTLETMVHKKPNLSSYSRISYMRELHGDIEGAIQTMQMAIDAGAPDAENTAWCMVQLANLYLNNGGLAEAERANRMALVRFPNYVHALAGLARVAVAQKDFIAAAQYYQQAVDTVPLPEFLVGLGEVYEHLNKPDEAAYQYELVHAIQKVYRSNGVNTDLEMVLFDLDHGGDVSRALDIARKEWQQRKSVKVADAYAWSLYRAGRKDEARSMMNQALRLGTKDPLIQRHAAALFHSSE
jgi:tetratricopeptide (TPR) repeat protein